MARRRASPIVIRRPGAATRQAKAAGESLGAWARRNKNAPGRKGRQARFAPIARKWARNRKRRGRR